MFGRYVNFTGMADGLVNGIDPNLIFYFPILAQNFSKFGGSRYWTMIASPVTDRGSHRTPDWPLLSSTVPADGAAHCV